MLQLKVKTAEFSKADQLKEFERPKVVIRSPEEIARGRQRYHQCVASFALEGEEPQEFGKVAAMEEVRGELTPDQCRLILSMKNPSETKRIEAKVARLHELGLSWKDL